MSISVAHMTLHTLVSNSTSKKLCFKLVFVFSFIDFLNDLPFLGKIYSFSGYYGYYKIFRLLSTFNIVQGTIVFIIKTLILINTVTLSLQTKHRL